MSLLVIGFREQELHFPIGQERIIQIIIFQGGRDRMYIGLVRSIQGIEYKYIYPGARSVFIAHAWSVHMWAGHWRASKRQD